jgi:hypothetical protein
MTGIVELMVIVGVVCAAVWLPGAVVTRLANMARGRGDHVDSFPRGGPAMDL